MAVGGVGIVASRINLADCDAAERRARVDLAAAHRLAVHYGSHEGIDNHFTLLLPGHADRFLLAPFGLHWSEVRASDFLVVDFAGNVLAGKGPVEDTAFHIHAPLHAARPDVQCVLHTHMPYATALSMLEDPALLMASQNAIGFDGLVALCDYAGFALDSSEGARKTSPFKRLIRSKSLRSSQPAASGASGERPCLTTPRPCNQDSRAPANKISRAQYGASIGSIAT